MAQTRSKPTRAEAPLPTDVEDPAPHPIEAAMAATPGSPTPPTWRTPAAFARRFVADLGPFGLFALGALTALSVVERFDAAAFGVLSPEIRSAFHLKNSSFLSIVTLTSALPILLSVPMGYAGDRWNRVRITRIGGLLWGVTAIVTGLAPALFILILARLGGGVGQLVNEPIHASLLADYYEPGILPSVVSFYRTGAAVIGLTAGLLAGFLGGVAGWRLTFVLLAIPTFVVVGIMARLREPERGLSMALSLASEDKVSMGEAFRQLRSVRSLRRTWAGAFFFGAGVIPFASYLSLYFKDVFHQGDAARGAFQTLFGAGGIIGLLLAQRLTRREAMAARFDRMARLTGLFILQFALFIAVMAVSPNIAMAIGAVFLLSFGASGFITPYQTTVALVITPRLRAQAYSWSLLFFSLGAIAWQLPIGAIADHHGERMAILVLAALVAGGGLIALTVPRFILSDLEQARRNEETRATSALLTCRGVDVAYDQVQVLFGVDLEVHEGEIVALLGTNGAGKSTLLKAISGINDPVGGAIYWDGRDITHADANTTVGLGIVQVPGGRGVFPTLTVAENLRASGWRYRKDKAYLEQATERVLEYFPVLRRRWNTEAGSLSGGEQQMLSLGQAFLDQPRLLLIDELSLGLAPTVVGDLLRIVKDIHSNGTTIILVEQSVNLALQLAERAVFMEKGEVRFSGPTAELLGRPDILRSVFLKGAVAGAPEGVDVASPATNGSRPAAVRAAAAAKERRREAVLEAPVVLATAGLTKRYKGITAVDGVDLTLHEGEILGLIGPNGAGKTTIFDLICGFTPMDGGRVQLHGMDVTAWPSHERAAGGLGRSFQDARLWPSLTVKESIMVGFERYADVRGVMPALLRLPVSIDSEAEIEEWTEELIEMLGLASFRDKFVSELSTGSRRIVEIATILAHRPSVLLLDEPSSGIAQRETEALGPLLRQVQARIGCSMLIIEHDMPLITSLADNLVGLERGSVVTWGRPDEVLNHPVVVESYLGTRAGELDIPGLEPAARPARRRGSSNGSGKAAAASSANGTRKAAGSANGTRKAAGSANGSRKAAVSSNGSGRAAAPSANGSRRRG
ncbi:MAG TPA: MFS transporter [Acidimicrobiales bacterium]|nr:MFS transporter [Acidimicrobiales bacterium]